MKKFLKGSIALLLAVTMIVGGTSCKIRSSSERFDNFLENQLKEVLETVDTLSFNFMIKDPGALDIEREGVWFPDVLGQYGDYETTQEEMDTLSAFFNYDKLTEEQKIMYDTFNFNVNLVNKYGRFDYYNDYCTGNNSVASYLLIMLAEYSFYDEKSIKDYIELLRELNNYFNDIIEFENVKSEKGLFISDESLDIFLSDCDKIINSGDNNVLILSFEERIDAFKGLDKEEKDSYIEKNKKVVETVVIPAYQRISKEMEKLRGTGRNNYGIASYPDGRDYYEYLAMGKTGTSMTFKDMRAGLEATYSACVDKIKDMEKNNETLNQRMQNSKFENSDATEILNYLKDKMAKDYPEIPQVNFTVKYVSKSLEENLKNPAFYLTPPIDDINENVIYINEKYSNGDIFATLAHEGYPGHLYQNTYLCSETSNLLRRRMSNQGYIEGWAEYVECNSYDYSGFDDDVIELMKLYTLCNILEMAIIDIRVNYDGMSYETFKTTFYEELDEEREEALKNFYFYLINEPAAYLPYAVGSMEINNMRDYAMDKLGNKFNLKDFHEVILKVGPVPFSIVWDKLEAYVNNAAVLEAA